MLVAAACGWAEMTDTSVEGTANYRNWGWDALVMRNGLITVAMVPAIGARIMQYDLGQHASIFVNPEELGKVYEPSKDSPWRNYGGYKVWPAPQSRWNWPPPPWLDSGPYTATIESRAADSSTVSVSGPTEQWRTPGVRMERRMTIFRGTSRVRVEQTIINQGETADHWGLWDVTQQVVNHPGERDFENYWVYFPLNPGSRYGSNGVRVSAESAAWRGEVAPGVFGVQFLPEGKKIFADSKPGWVCYVDERAGCAYAKTFELSEGVEYPDEGAHVEVWVNTDPLLYLEVEVVSPIVELAASGGRYTFTEDWWAARVPGPILTVNRVGAMAERLRLADGLWRATGGTFHQGECRLVFVDRDGNVVGRGRSRPVSPLETYVLKEKAQVPRGAVRTELRVSDRGGTLIGVLDALDLPRPAGLAE